MSTEIKQTLVNALNQYRGDNLARAKLAWGNLPTEEMNKKYGQSDCTKQELLDSYQKKYDEVQAALDWVNKQ